jgi:gliding motility-associated-like protein
LLAALAFASLNGSAQTLSHQVLNAGGADHQVGGFWITDNVGETFVESFAPTAVNFMLTGGFLQPEILAIEIGGVIVYNGVTPNGDGRNDVWIIEGIEEFPDNTVMLFNRWGKKIFEAERYDNEARYWPTSDDLSNLAASTYFYIIVLSKDSKPIKGWVELIKN